MSDAAIKITYMMAQGLVAALAPRNVLGDPILEPARRGKSATRRAAIIPWSGYTDGPSGSAAMIEAKRSVAVSFGN
jgi:hypothetical protein